MFFKINIFRIYFIKLKLQIITIIFKKENFNLKVACLYEITSSFILYCPGPGIYKNILFFNILIKNNIIMK